MSFPREALRPKHASIRREICKARDSGDCIGQSAQSPLELRVRFHRDAGAEATRDEVYERLAVDKTNIDPSRNGGRRKLQSGRHILQRDAR